MLTHMRKILVITFSAVICMSTVPLVFAEIPDLPGPPPEIDGSTAGVPEGPPPEIDGSTAGVPEGPPPEIDGSTAGVPEGPPPEIDGSTTAATGGGSPLQISVPPSHGLPGSGGVQATITNVINNVIGFVAIIAIVAIIVSAIQLMAAQGRADAIAKAKKNIFGIILGFVIFMLAWSIVNIVLQFLGFS